MGLFTILTGSGAFALAAFGLAMARFDELKLSRGLFWTSGIAATTGGLWWELTTTEPAALRVGAGITTGIAVFVVLPMVFRWLRRLETQTGSPPSDTAGAP